MSRNVGFHLTLYSVIVECRMTICESLDTVKLNEEQALAERHWGPMHVHAEVNKQRMLVNLAVYCP
jgi:hypothetical protein